ncbi:MAG TPA: flagellin [Gemmatimonadales bacterium]|nr:flagellin [Gemmatimonadales bacterium]
MSTRIATNTTSYAAYLALTNNQEMMDASIQKLSTGFRINKASDDAAGAAISDQLTASAASLQAAQRNASQAASVLQIADGGVQTIASILDRMKELATEAASDSSGTTGRANLNAEYQQLVQEIDQISQTTQYQGSNLLDGTYSGTFLVSSSGQYATNDTITLSGAGLNMASATLLGAAAGDLTTLANAQGELTKIDTAITNVGTAIGTIGAAESRIQYATTNVGSTFQNVQSANSVIKDTDMAYEMTQFTKYQILSQASTAMLAQANQAPQSILKLISG